jgi:hypothetical protein
VDLVAVAQVQVVALVTPELQILAVVAVALQVHPRQLVALAAQVL